MIKASLQVQRKIIYTKELGISKAKDVAKNIYMLERLGGFTRGMTSHIMWIAPLAMIMLNI